MIHGSPPHALSRQSITRAGITLIRRCAPPSLAPALRATSLHWRESPRQGEVALQPWTALNRYCTILWALHLTDACVTKSQSGRLPRRSRVVENISARSGTEVFSNSGAGSHGAVPRITRRCE